MTVERRTDPVVVWHDVECGSYSADLPVWEELASEAGGPVLDIGAGTGRVALALGRAGYEIVALDREPVLLRMLDARADGLPITTVCADARDFDLERRFALCIVPMQTIQLLATSQDRRAMLDSARRHLSAGGLFAAALAADLEPFDASSAPPLPDIREEDGVVYASRPVALRAQDGRVVIQRIRETVSPDGHRTEEPDEVILADLGPDALEDELQAAGFEVLTARRIPPTREHVGSWVVIGRA
jgi:SAM-dependent methyltransferase